MNTYLDILLNEPEPCTLARMLFEDYDGDEYSIIEFLNKLGIFYPIKDASKLYSHLNKIVLNQKGKLIVYNFLKQQGVFHEADLPDSHSDLGGFHNDYQI